MKVWLASIIVLFSLSMTGFSAAQVADVQQEIERKRQAQEELRRKIQDDKRKGERIKRQERSILLDLQQVDRRIDKLNREISDSRAGIKRSEDRIAIVRGDLGGLEAALASSQKRLGRRLRQMYKSGKTNALNYLLNAKNPADFQRRLKYVRSVATADAELIRRTREHQRALAEKKAELEVEAVALACNKRKLERSRGKQVGERRNKKALARRVKGDRLLLEKSLAEKKVRAAKLDQMITGLYKEKDRRIKIARVSSGAFGKKKGYLPWPVKGKVIHRFGRQKYAGIKAYSECAGIKIKATHGVPIRAVAAGRVLFADWYMGYGKMVVVDHGDGYGSVYTHASEIEVSKGQQVSAGGMIARVGSTESLSGEMLYFQIRHYGKPLDPWPWLEH